MPNLILIPTAFEREQLLSALQCEATSSIDAIDCRIELCGFGLVAAAARTANWIARIRPQHVVLVGIAGSYRDTVAVGQACCFDAVRCMGIGVGSLDQDSYRSAESLGWPQVAFDPASNDPIGDELNLFHHGEAYNENLLLSVTGASANRDHAAKRAAMFPKAIAEDMEGYAVALACRLYDVPLTIIRGISNQAGDRNHGGWQVAEALHSAAKLLGTICLRLQ